jgi:small-conductance mechanosensitive channel
MVMEVSDFRLIGVNIESVQKLLLTIALIVIVYFLQRGLQAIARSFLRDRVAAQRRFWIRQAIGLGMTILLLLGLFSIWFDDPGRLATALGLVTAGLAFALQRVITAIAGYFVILRGHNFTVGDRITMGGVRGDVVGLGFIQTTIMEMGQPPSVSGSDPAIWVRSRQYTGRIVTVSNSRIFDEPVYNYTRDFPYLWEELSLTIGYGADRERAEGILLESAQRHTGKIADESRGALAAMQRRYYLQPASVDPQVYYRMTPNRLELTVRFVTEARGVRDVKDAMSRDILLALDEAGISPAPADELEIVGLPTLQLQGQASIPSETQHAHFRR